MEIETTPGDNKILNRLVAVTVVLLSVFMAVSKIKDDNIVQAIQAAKADSIDAWNEYQSAKMKLHLEESAANQARLVATIPGADASVIQAEKARAESAVKSYADKAAQLMQKAKSFEPQLQDLNFKDDQFDLSDACLSVAIAVSAVAALIGSMWLLGIAWAFGAAGLAFGIAAFAGLGLHPDALVRFLS